MLWRSSSMATRRVSFRGVGAAHDDSVVSAFRRNIGAAEVPPKGGNYTETENALTQQVFLPQLAERRFVFRPVRDDRGSAVAGVDGAPQSIGAGEDVDRRLHGPVRVRGIAPDRLPRRLLPELLEHGD